MFPEKLSGQPKGLMAVGVFGTFLAILLERKYPGETQAKGFINRLEEESGWPAADWDNWIYGRAIPLGDDTREALAVFLKFDLSGLLLLMQYAECLITEAGIEKLVDSDVGRRGSLTVNSLMIAPEAVSGGASPPGKMLRGVAYTPI